MKPKRGYIQYSLRLKILEESIRHFCEKNYLSPPIFIYLFARQCGKSENKLKLLGEYTQSILPYDKELSTNKEKE